MGGADSLWEGAAPSMGGPLALQLGISHSELFLISPPPVISSLPISAPLAAPTLSLHPRHPFYLHGERVTLRCSAPGGKRLQGYRFYGEQERLIHEEVPAPDGGARLEIVAEMGKAGVYTCAYWTLRSGRHILSEGSRPVSLSVQGEASFPGRDVMGYGGYPLPWGLSPPP